MRFHLLTGIILLGLFTPLASQAAVGLMPNKAEDLTFGAAKALEERDLKTVDQYTKRCLSLYRGQARNQQRHLKEKPMGDTSHENWALNMVAYCHFLRGKMYELKEKYRKAYREYDTVSRKYEFAMVFDADNNLFWSVEEAAQKRKSFLENTQAQAIQK